MAPPERIYDQQSSNSRKQTHNVRGQNQESSSDDSTARQEQQNNELRNLQSNEEALESIMPSRLGRGAAQGTKMRFQPKLGSRTKRTPSVAAGSNGDTSSSSSTSSQMSTEKNPSGSSRRDGVRSDKRTGLDSTNRGIRQKLDLQASGPFAYGPAASAKDSGRTILDEDGHAGRKREDNDLTKVKSEPLDGFNDNMYVDENRFKSEHGIQDVQSAELGTRLMPISLSDDGKEAQQSMQKDQAAKTGTQVEKGQSATAPNKFRKYASAEEAEESRRLHLESNSLYEILIKAAHDATGGYGSSFLFQFPPKLLCGTSVEVDSESTQAYETGLGNNEDTEEMKISIDSEISEDPDEKSKVALEDPKVDTVQVGTLNLHKSGKVSMTVHGVPLQLLAGTKYRFAQQLAQIDLAGKELRPLEQIQESLVASLDIE